MKTRLTWFKHSNTASSGVTLGSLYAKRDYEAIAMWWLLLELISRGEDRGAAPGQVTISWSLLAREMGSKPCKCRRILDRILSVSSSFRWIETGSKLDRNVTFLLSNWLEFQETRGQKKCKKNAKNPGDIRIKNKEVRIYNAQSAHVELDGSVQKKSARDEPERKFDFEKLYANYPRKVGKSRGLGTCRKKIKTAEDYDALAKAIDRYCKYVSDNHVEAQYVQHFSTFMNSWRDWLDANAGTVEKPGPKLRLADLWE